MREWFERRLIEAWDWVTGLARVGCLAVATGVATAYQEGKIGDFAALGDVVHHATLTAIPIVIAWVMMRNPSHARELADLKKELLKAQVDRRP